MNNVLVVDDEKEICMLLTGMMKKLGFDTSYANNIEEGKLKLRSSEYNVVFLDLNLPDGLGFHLIEEVEDSNPNAKIIVISAYDGNIEKQRAKSEGADFFIAKPFSKQSVTEALLQLNVPFNKLNKS
ncbi:response regulator, partial [Fulvivirga sp. RKSG066]|uniref:response regulator n=1 Tax=Fulvivirga aurantia TaxID=2529383 RepID=UPI0012BBEFF6